MNAKQILENAGLSETHWGEVIIAAEERGSFSGNECAKASNWSTCACGKTNLPLSMRDGDVPRDTQLLAYGIDFTGNVGEHEFVAAAKTLIAIEERVAELLTDLKEKPHGNNILPR